MVGINRYQTPDRFSTPRRSTRGSVRGSARGSARSQVTGIAGRVVIATSRERRSSSRLARVESAPNYDDNAHNHDHNDDELVDSRSRSPTKRIRAHTLLDS